MHTLTAITAVWGRGIAFRVFARGPPKVFAWLNKKKKNKEKKVQNSGWTTVQTYISASLYS